MLLAAACQASLDRPAGVDVEVVAGSALSDADVARVAQLRLETGGAEQRLAVYYGNFPTARRWHLRFEPTAITGDLTLVVSARSADGAPLGLGQAVVSLRPHAALTVTIMLGADLTGVDGGTDLAAPPLDLSTDDLARQPKGDAATAEDLAMPDLTPPPDLRYVDLAPPPDLTDLTPPPDLTDLTPPPDLAHAVGAFSISPGSATVYVGGTQSFATNAPADFQISGAPPGAFIDANGVFHGQSLGPYAVVATRRSDGAQAEAFVSVLTVAIQKVTGQLGGTGNIDGKGANARFNGLGASGNPRGGLASDGAGHLFVADYGNNTIRSVDISGGAGDGTVTTFAGSPGQSGSLDDFGTAARFNAPQALACDGLYLYVADGNNTIRQIVLATGQVSTLAGSPGFYGDDEGTGSAAHFKSVGALALDDLGNLYAADGGACRIERVVTSTGQMTHFAGTGTCGSGTGALATAQLANPYGLVWRGPDASAVLYYLEHDDGQLKMIDIPGATVSIVEGPTTLQPSGWQDGTGSTVRFYLPYDMTLVDDSINNVHALFVSDTSNAVIRRVDLGTLAVTTPFGHIPAPQAGYGDGVGNGDLFQSPGRITADGNGHLYVGDADTVRRVTLSSQSVQYYANRPRIQSTFNLPGGNALFLVMSSIAVAGNHVYVADSSTVRDVTLNDQNTTTLAGDAANSGNHNDFGTSATFGAVSQVVTGGANKLFVADFGNGEIRQIALDNNALVSTLAGGASPPKDDQGLSAGFESPTGIAFDGNQFLYVADYSTLRRVDVGDGTVTTVAGKFLTNDIVDDVGSAARFGGIEYVALDGAGAAWVLDSNAVRRIDLATRLVTTPVGFPGASGYRDGVGNNARFSALASISCDGSALFVGDGPMVRRIDLDGLTTSTLFGSFGSVGVRLGILPGSFNVIAGVAHLHSNDWLIADDGEGILLRGN